MDNNHLVNTNSSIQLFVIVDDVRFILLDIFFLLSNAANNACAAGDCFCTFIVAVVATSDV